MAMVKRTMEEIEAWAESPECKVNLEKTMARLSLMRDIPKEEDPENPWITDFSGWMTLDEARTFRTSRKNQTATV
jgi:hypothetical protein